MRILDINGVEITNPDYSLGHLVEEKILKAHHEAVEAVEEQGHYEVVAEYPNGGKDVAWVVDIPGVEAREAWDEYEDIHRFIPFTAEELAEIERNKKIPSMNERMEALEAAFLEMMGVFGNG